MWLFLSQLAIPGEAKSHSMRKWHQKNGSCQNLSTTFLNFPTFELLFWSYIYRVPPSIHWREVSRCFRLCQQCPTKTDCACKRAIIKAGKIFSNDKDLIFEHETAERSQNMANPAPAYASLRYIVDSSVPQRFQERWKTVTGLNWIPQTTRRHTWTQISASQSVKEE